MGPQAAGLPVTRDNIHDTLRDARLPWCSQRKPNIEDRISAPYVVRIIGIKTANARALWRPAEGVEKRERSATGRDSIKTTIETPCI